MAVRDDDAITVTFEANGVACRTPHRRACLVPVADGMVVRSAKDDET